MASSFKKYFIAKSIGFQFGHCRTEILIGNISCRCRFCGLRFNTNLIKKGRTLAFIFIHFFCLKFCLKFLIKLNKFVSVCVLASTSGFTYTIERWMKNGKKEKQNDLVLEIKSPTTSFKISMEWTGKAFRHVCQGLLCPSWFLILQYVSSYPFECLSFNVSFTYRRINCVDFYQYDQTWTTRTQQAINYDIWRILIDE